MPNHDRFECQTAIDSDAILHSAGDKEAQGVPNGRLGAKSDLSGDTVGVKKMEYANPELAAGNEPFYYRVW